MPAIELLRSYRVAHARVLSIEPFETSLRENTPLTSISDPAALVEYLNQLNLKGDMVLDELKRVSIERDNFKTKLEEAERSTKEAWDEVASLRVHKDTTSISGEAATSLNGLSSETEMLTKDVTDESTSTTAMKSPTASIKSRASSIPSLSLFSPRVKSVEAPKLKEEIEEFFSYDSEVPRLESELRDREEEVKVLQIEVKTLKDDLAVARESTQSMVQSLEAATRDLNVLRDNKERSKADLEEQHLSSEKLQNQLRSDLESAEEKLTKLEPEAVFQGSAALAELEGKLQGANEELEMLRVVQRHSNSADELTKDLQSTIQDLQSEVSRLQSTGAESEKRIETLNGLVKNLRQQLTEAENQQRALMIEVDEKTRTTAGLEAHFTKLKELREDTTDAMNVTGLPAEQNGFRAVKSHVTENEAINASEGTTTGKKKNKKKKRSGKAAADQTKEPPIPESPVPDITGEGSQTPEENSNLKLLQEALSDLRKLVEEKDAAIQRLHSKLKDQEDLREEIEGLRDDLINVGQGHVEAKYKVKELLAEKQSLERTITSLEGELAELRSAHTSQTAGSERAQKDLAAQFEDLKLKATTLQTDLSAAQQLAASRFKDISDLRNVLQKAQPELAGLRSEVAELKVIREELGKKTAELTRLEVRQEDMRSEVAGLKRTVAERDTEAKVLNQKIGQETNNRLKAEDISHRALDDLQRAEAEKRQSNQSLDRLSRDLSKSQEEVTSAKARLRELEQQIASISRETEGLKEDIELKTAQHASAQSLMGSMRDQTSEMAMQMKEARERCESLEEEVADAHRLLSERSREGETMRRLLADVEGRAESRIREMKERMDTAIEERDRAEDEASAAGRRRARELEDLRNKIREAEKGLKRAEEDKEELETGRRDWKRRREELEQRSEQSAREAEEVRKAMSELRDALDESEKQARDLEKQKIDLRRTVEDTQQRLEKLQKANKVCLELLEPIPLLANKSATSRWPTRSDRCRQRKLKRWIRKAGLLARLSTPPRLGHALVLQLQKAGPALQLLAIRPMAKPQCR